MFGYPSFFINGNMFAGLFADQLFLRLSDKDQAEISQQFPDVAPFEPMIGRPMKSYVVLPKSLYADSKVFDEWLDKSMKYTSELPVKKGKPSKAKMY
jgi:TfoX/Sxy family transcriptional regulator of competence genes